MECCNYAKDVLDFLEKGQFREAGKYIKECNCFTLSGLVILLSRIGEFRDKKTKKVKNEVNRIKTALILKAKEKYPEAIIECMEYVPGCHKDLKRVYIIYEGKIVSSRHLIDT